MSVTVVTFKDEGSDGDGVPVGRVVVVRAEGEEAEAPRQPALPSASGPSRQRHSGGSLTARPWSSRESTASR